MSKRVEVEDIDATTYAGKAAAACRTKFRGVLNGDLVTLAMVDVVNFMLLHTKFMSHNINITEDNKEECYIKIIEMNNEGLIEDLEKYIALKDKIKMIEDKRDEYYDIISRLQSLADKQDKQAVNSIIEDYLRR